MKTFIGQQLCYAQSNKAVLVILVQLIPYHSSTPEYVLSEPLRLSSEQSKELLDFLLENEQLLIELAEKDEIVARQQLTDLFKKIAEYGREKTLGTSE